MFKFYVANLDLGIFGPHLGGSYRDQGGLSFYVGGNGRKWSQISHKKLKNSISLSMVIWV